MAQRMKTYKVVAVTDTTGKAVAIPAEYDNIIKARGIGRLLVFRHRRKSKIMRKQYMQTLEMVSKVRRMLRGKYDLALLLSPDADICKLQEIK